MKSNLPNIMRKGKAVDENYIQLNLWKKVPRKQRIPAAREIAKILSLREETDPFSFNRITSHLTECITCPWEYGFSYSYSSVEELPSERRRSSKELNIPREAKDTIL